MKSFITTTFARAGGWLAGARRVRAAMMLLLLLLSNSFTALAQTEGPWTYYEDHKGNCAVSQCTNGLAYNSLGGGAWQNWAQYNNDWGMGFVIGGYYPKYNKMAIYSLYTHTENVPSYTRKVLTWNYTLSCYSTTLHQRVGVYAADNLENLKASPVDFDIIRTAQFSQYYLYDHWQHNTNGRSESPAQTYNFDFDNRNGSSNVTKQWNLMAVWVIMNAGSGTGNLNDNQTGGFKTQNWSVKDYYYLYVTFDANGGSGSMSQQTIENSGTLKACSFTRNGYVFAGWNTKADGSGTYYADAITATTSNKGPVKLYAQWLSTADNLNGVLIQKDRKVKLTWNTKSGSSPRNGTFVVYRNDTKIGTVAHTFNANAATGLTFEDTNDFPYESNAVYDVYLVPDGMDEDTKRSDCKLSVTVSTTRTVPVSTPNAEGKSDRIVFTWTSDGYPAGWGNQFKIYVDNETEPIDTITPTDNQTNFQWEHRTTDGHSDRQSFIDENTGVPYTEEALNACQPHTYRIDGVIGTAVLNSTTFVKKAIGTGTLFYSLDATKGAYPGTVKLQWHVNQQGNTAAKTYIVDRRRTEKDNEAWVTLYRTSSNEDYLMYTDDTPLPGVYYDYRVTVEDKCSDGTIISNETTDIGFAQTTGTMSGRITFGATGSSVANVSVEAKRTGASGDDEAQYHAMRFTGSNGAVTWKYPTTTYAADKLATGDFTIQLWVNPETLAEAKIVRLNGETCYVGMDANGKLTLVDGSTTYTFDNAVLTAGQYNHVVLTRSGTTVTAGVVGADEAGVAVLNSSTQTLDGELTLTDAAQLTLGHFVGYVDEFRLWTKALTEAEILENYDHLLVGNEKQLETYWTFDEGLNTQFFDYSRDGTVYHQHHGLVGSNAQPSNLTPTQLKLKAKTDRDGNYIIQGVSFSGEGTTYAVIPTLGIHQFNPTQQLRFVGNNSLVHNGTDFTDISSFPVRGTIRYANTDYPVEGVQFYVDGQICAKEGEPITTDINGEYEISVPIGEHYITVAKQGHEFANDGRYPADPNKTGMTVNYNDAVSNLDFEDVTLVTVAGRVTGGKIEEEKPLGFGQSVNNIGQATITLGIDGYRLNVVRNVSGTTVSYDSNADDLAVSSPTTDVNSEAWRQGGDADAVKKIVIKTDPQTGEFAALLPPIDYRVESIEIESNQSITFDNLPTLYASDPTQTETDSLTTEDGTKKEFEYVAKLIQSYYTDPVLEVTQKDRTDGSFGERTYTYSDKVTPETEVPLYTFNSQLSTLNYTFGYPLFKQQNTYIFNVRGYETYVNNDGESPVTYEVPLRDVEVTFTNQMGTGQQVVINPELTAEDDSRGDLGETAPDKVTLDENGEAQYEWMAGLPNITAPYTLSLAATFVQNDRTYTWGGVNATNSLAGVVTGALPSGNNFVTNGPDQISMILRDPAGSASQAYWEAGNTVTSTLTSTQSYGRETEMATHTEIGFELTTFAGVGVGAFAGAITTTRDMVTVDLNVTTEISGEDSETKSISITNNKRIATSDQPEYVGAQGDVFVGNATNVIFGDARSVGLQKDGENYTLTAADNYVTGQEFSTTFHYTQNHIENVLIPNFIAQRNAILHNGYDSEGVTYATTLSEDDELYGTAGTYTSTKPENATKAFYTDMVAYYNEQIKNWEGWLAYNEKVKVEAITNRRRYLDSNQSFDSGTFIESSATYTTSSTTSHTSSFNNTILIGAGTDFEFAIATMNVNLQNTTSFGYSETTEDGYERTVTTGYALVETGDDDALTIDVFKAPDGMGAIFVTRGGQTTCPYEGEQKTKYFEPGEHIIAAATMQIEKPAIAVENAANRAVGVPAGKKASYNLLLTNESETGEDCYYSLFAIDETNTEGAKLTINGDPFDDSRRVLVPAGGTVRMNLELAQNNTGGLVYEDIAIVLASECQSDPASTWDVIGDTVLISAEFVPTSTDVALRIDNRVVNTSTKGMLPLTVTGYDPNYDGLKYIAVQYQGVGENVWHDARKYVMNEQAIQNPQIEEVLPTNGIINLNYDMTNSTVFPDRTYKFRAISARAYDTSEVTNVSDEILVVKDMSRPKPLGQPQPTDGIFSAGDELSVLFNETILNGELTKDQNFRVTGVLNGSEVAHQTALELENTVQTAATEANINLANKDFSVDMWVKANGAGTLLSHGTGTQKLTVGVDADSKLVVKIGDQTYTSNNIVPQNQWAFLTLSMTQGGKLSASVATDATTTTLFSDMETVAYEGNGPLAVGQQMTGAMHELLLWDEARDVTTALQQRSVTKSPSTQGLIGYWKMNEGEGTILTDYARNRHMTMAAETWHIENENKAVTLDGSHYVGINTTEIPPMPQDDYAVELWVKAGEQTADAQLLQLGEVGLSLDTEGKLQLENKNSQLSIVNSPLTDNAWHHVALSVLRGGNANVYVDGVAKATVSADNVGSLGSDQLLIGARRTLQDVQSSEVLYTYDRPLTATIDEVRIWNATMNGDQLKKQRKVRLTGTEPGLVAYYPFEVKTLNAQNQVVTNGSAADLCGSGHEAQLSTLNSELSTLNYSDVAPALRVKPEEENVSFTFTASDNKIVIDIDEAPARIEGTTLNFTVRDVHDQNGNLSEPVSWSAFVSLNPLAWKESSVSSTSKVTDGATLTATLVNKSGRQQVWTMSDLPSWLEADMTYGDLQPLAEQTITFAVSEATPIGKYEQTVYVAGNDGIETPLTLNITVTGNVPDWAVNPNDFETSMNVIAVLKKDGTPMTDTDDLMAAFVGEECRGVAHPAYNERYGNYYVTMDIYGANTEAGQEVTFRAYDASTGTVYPVVTLENNEAFTFVPLTLMGTYAKPNVFIIRNMIEQELELKAGWNWVSFNVTADDMTVPALFEKIADDVVTVKSQMSGYRYYENGTWGGDLTGNLSNTEMYAVQMLADRKLRVVGTSVNTPVSVHTGWNWLGYYGRQVASLGDALQDLEKTDGDMLKAQRGVSYWDVNSRSGSLLMMEPGVGYQLKSTAADHAFSYPSATVAGAHQITPRLAPAMANGQTTMFSPVNFRNYPDNAIMAVKVVADSKTLTGVEVAAFAGDECRTATVTNEEGIAFLTIPGDETCELTFKVAVAGEVVDVPLTLTYETDAIYGTPKHPVVMNLGDATSIHNAQFIMHNGDTIYDLSGRKVRLDDQTRKLQKGVYIINGQKHTVK